ncbi:hypothetical protein BV22DRAFT_1023699, partial [Leucogyrophana mollusca]
PFTSQQDWEMASWLLRSGLSMGSINSLLSLELMQKLPLSFRMAKELHGHAELLPSGPRWLSKVIPTTFPTKSPIVLYWCDPLECLESLFNNPLYHGKIDFTP